MTREQELLKQRDTLYNALLKTYEHLQYCNWGDSWEREVKSTLEPIILNALTEGLKK